ncbi:hypothetical protein J7T55_009685 [Diaporthe amygdali]|uniref:uncharacterized protein n=1 Tax=Phomopsis amygdali TaxID=1214568 RepID=UPI0022FEBE4F|nr:uncharacterized protein J7T55_009685 [Diaporthe amygdali]KAJ0104021.1 hypothetical protein J7T55_009685 [Diaporthe amygdali]
MSDVEQSADSTRPAHGDRLSERPTGSSDDDIEELGRKRPAVFKNVFMELGFCISILASNLVSEFLISGMSVLLPSLVRELHIPSESQTWPASVFTLVAGAFLLPFGRLCDMYGASIVFLTSIAWLTIWTLVGGFSSNLTMLLVTRALQGLGSAANLPAGLALLSNVYRPGPRKNFVFSLYGGCAPFGFFTGILVAGLSGQVIHWGWFFWIVSMSLGATGFVSFFCIPRDVHPRQGSMDWWGCATSIPGIFLLVYAITESSHVRGGWGSPQIIVTFVLGALLLAGFVYVENRRATHPLLPASIFAPKHMVPLFLYLFLVYGCFGIYLFYASFYIETVLKVPSFLAALWFAPLAAGGILIALVGGMTLHRLSGTLLLLLSGSGFLVCVLLFAVMPEQPSYWAWVFPAMVCTTLGIDISYNVSSIFITTNVAKHEQGLAGACVNGLVFLGIAFFLGWADLAVSKTAYLGVRGSYKTAFFLGAGCAGVAIVLVALGIRVEKAKSSLTVDEKEGLRDGTLAGDSGLQADSRVAERK